MRVGIPRALLYYYYIPFWRTFFESLGIEVVASDATNKGILNQGVSESVSEICVPIKIFVGHVKSLLKKNVDYIFVPRMVSTYPGEYFCPKFMGLPDLLRHSVKGMEGKMLTVPISTNSDDISDYKLYLPMKEILNVSEAKIKEAAERAGEYWREFRKVNKLGYTITEADEIVKSKQRYKSVPKSNDRNIRLGLMGYVYNIYDPFVNMNIIEKLNELNVEFVTFDMMDENELKKNIEHLKKPLFWTFSNKVLGAGYSLFHDRSVDGIIHITAFGCGPDSFLGKLFEYQSNDTGIPFMTVRIDEHTGENHLQTRVEAFIDMLKRKKYSRERVVGIK